MCFITRSGELIMDIYTKIFLINAISLVFLAAFDRNIMNDKIENSFVQTPLYIWAGVSFLSAPVWLVYFIVIN